MLDQGLLTWGGVDEDLKEKLYEKQSSGKWKLEAYSEDVKYDMEYTRTQLKILVRIKLTGEKTTAAIRNRWLTGIRNAWNGKYHIEGPRRLRLVFQPTFTSSNPHYKIKVHNKPGMRENSGNWELNTTGPTAAHEFGHLVGHEDEYNRTAADFQRITGRAPTMADRAVPGVSGAVAGYTDWTSIMVAGFPSAKQRHFIKFLNWLNKNRAPGEKPFRLVLGP